MSRAQAKRPWIKLYIIPCLEGSIRYQLEPAERCVWYDLLLLAGIQPEPGIIADSDGRPYPHKFIANRLNIEMELLDKVLKECADEGRITEDEHGITIVNWKIYQSEYQRQKPYRDEKKEERPKEYWHCPKCNYSLEKGRVTARMETCPVCLRKGKEIKMEVRTHP